MSRSRSIAIPPGSNADRSVLGEWWRGTRLVDTWLFLAWFDLLLRYRRSLLGPLWLTISMGVMIAGMGPLYATLFGTELKSFFPYLTLGIIFWSFIAGVVNEGCLALVSSGSSLKQADHPVTAVIWRLLARHLLQLAHHVLIYLPVAWWCGIEVRGATLAFLPGLVLVVLTMHALALTLSIVCARFRDVAQIVASVVQLLMFVTPVFWLASALPAKTRFVLYNPLAGMLELLRSPLLGEWPSTSAWLVTAGTWGVSTVVSLLLLARTRRRIAYWI